MNLLPIIFVGGAIAFLSGKKKRKKNGTPKPLPPSSDRGTMFEGDTEKRPDVIKAKVGERFSVSFFDNPSTGGIWKLNASPPDNSIELVKKESDKLPEPPPNEVGSPTAKDVYIFEGKKPGKGSLVFHWQYPWLEGKEPPAEIVEILTEIS